MELPPLYPNIQWKEPERGKPLFINHDRDTIEQMGSRYESELLEDYPDDFLNYYNSDLTIRGWIKTDYASVPGSELYGYEKNDRYITIGFRSVSREPVKYSAFVEHN